jgi:UDP-N-acetylmuramyl pentapeptide phosphotransferase/UDP-N-acetylglucosamine-1-phosphate transferase
MSPDHLAVETLAAIFTAGFLLCTAIIALLLRGDLAWRLATDLPNDRSLHSTPIPRAGGWGIVPAVLAVAFAFGAADGLLAALATVLFLVSYADDRIGLPIYVRLPTHVAAAAAWLAFGPIHLPLVTCVLAAFAIAWIINLFNFMDGADGLAGGMAFFAFLAYAAAAFAGGAMPLVIWSLAIAGAAAGFLIFNFNPARVFLGDAGSVTLGFLAGAFGIWGWAGGLWPAWFPFLVSAPFFLDATATILRRMIGREAFWRPHREHFYQRLIRSGWTHRRTALWEYCAMAASSGLAVAMLHWSTLSQYLGLAAAGAAYLALACAINRRWAKFESRAADRPGRNPGRADAAGRA